MALHLVKRHNSNHDPVALFQREVDSWLDQFWRNGLSSSHSQTLADFSPRIDVKNDKESIKIVADLPGVSEKDIQVKLAPTHDTLILRGEKKSEQEENREGYYHCERMFGSFYREIPLQCEVNPEQLQAEYKNGVLTVSMLKSKNSSKECDIPVKFS